VDRAGWEIQWGCLVWVPSVYTFHSRFTVQHPSGLSQSQAGVIFTIGLLGVAFNYWADLQRQQFRSSGGKGTVWGRPPVYIAAHYSLVDPKTGEKTVRRSLLLASGFWGVARHFHYVFELIAAWSWCLLANPAKNGAFPLFYAIFLSTLLFDRAKRDERKCQAKYGADYDKYSALVPYLIIPGVY
jgi:7-dehydrocholesterol reductase